MKSTIKSLLIICSSFILIFICCKKKGLCDYDFPNNLNNSAIQIIFKDKVTGKYLYSQVTPLYNIDSIEILNPLGEKMNLIISQNLIPNTASLYSEVNFGNIYDYRTDSLSFKQLYNKSFIIKYNSKELDTIVTSFKSMITECGSQFQVLKAFYKGQLIDSVLNDTHLNLTIYKK